MTTLSLNELERIRESSEELSSSTKDVIKIFIAAINDWPSTIFDPETYCLKDYELEVRNFIGAKTTKANIDKSMSEINFLRNSWEAESLVQIQELFKYYGTDISLIEIIDKLQKELLQ